MSRSIQNVQSYDDATRLISALAVDAVNQKIDLFNASSGYALVLSGMTSQGDFTLRKFVKDIRSAAHYRRDPASTAARSAVAYQEGEQISVKIAGGFGPVSIPASVLMWVGEGSDPGEEVSEALNAIAEQYADAYLQDQLNSSIAALAGAIGNVPAVTLDNSANNTAIRQLDLNDMYKLFGDKQSEIVTLVVHSGAYNGLLADGIANGNNLDTVGGVVINTGTIGAQGRRIIYTDSPSLAYNDGTRDVYKVLGLTAGASEVSVIKEIASMNRSTDSDNITDLFQANYDFKLALKGYSYVGSAVPSDAEIATGANYSQVTASIKNTAGVCGIFVQAPA